MTDIVGDYALLSTPISVASADPSGQARINKATALNRDSVTRYLTVWRVPAASAPTDDDLVIQASAILPGDTRVLPLSGFSLVNGGALYAKADADSVINLSLSYASQ